MRPLLNSLLALSFAGAAPAAAQTIAITHADLITLGPAGEIKSGVVLIRGGKITAVGADLPIPAGAQVIDAGGEIVTPGLVSTGTPIGVVEVEDVEQTDDQATSSDKLSAAFDVQYAINPQSLVIPIARLGGVTDAVATPTLPYDRGAGRKDMVFAGQAAVFALAGDDPVERSRAGMVLAMGEHGASQVGGGRGAELVLLRSIFDNVRDYAKNRAAYDRNQSRSYDLSREDLEALIPVVEGREPLIVSVHRAADILQVLKLAKEEHLKLVLEGAEEGWRVAPQIAAAGVPVMTYGAADLPSSFETLGSTLENAARLNAAGVMIALETPSLFTGGRTPRFDAGRAVAHGLPYGVALAAITLNPAKMWGVADRIGSLEVGKDADLVVWDGDPLETTSAPTAILIKGVVQPLRSRDLDLRDRYLPQDTAAPAAP
jgi:imidazolonepropionase-like amidohydrolase